MGHQGQAFKIRQITFQTNLPYIHAFCGNRKVFLLCLYKKCRKDLVMRILKQYDLPKNQLLLCLYSQLSDRSTDPVG